MKLFRSRVSGSGPTVPGFGEWAVWRLTPETPTAMLTFAQLEHVLSNAASLICGAAYDNAQAFLGRVPLDVPAQHEAMIIARRTADGFQASLDDRDHVVLAWPWDHLATRVAWLTTQAGNTTEASVGEALFVASVTYTLMHSEQLDSVFALWAEVATSVRRTRGLATPAVAGASLPQMGRQLFEAFMAVSGAGS